MSVSARPFIGTWRLGQQKLVQVTPDALVYINGDLALPGCQKCHSRIDLQRFITEVSVDAGVGPDAASASFSLAIPAHHRDSFIRDAQFILQPGLEVHVYVRGYFPVKGMYSNLVNPTTTVSNGAPPVNPKATTVASEGTLSDAKDALNRGSLNSAQKANAITILDAFDAAGHPVAVGMAACSNAYVESGLSASPSKSSWLGMFQLTPDQWPIMVNGVKKVAGTADTETTYNALNPGNNIKAILSARSRIANVDAAAQSGQSSIQDLSLQFALSVEKPGGLLYHSPGDPLYDKEAAKREAAAITVFGSDIATKPGYASGAATSGSPTSLIAETGPSLLAASNLEGYDIENVLAYPYYHVFHGVVTQAGHAYSSGVTTATIQCVSMLHFWQYQQMSTQASTFGARAPNSGLHISTTGNNFTNKHPYEIIYALHADSAGAAASVSWALDQKTNQTAVSSVTGEPLFALSTRYWEQRFKNIKLRMHGVTGEMFNSVQAAFLASTSTDALTALIRGRFDNSGKSTKKGKSIFAKAESVGMLGPKRKLEALIQARKRQSPENRKNNPSLEISMPEMVAFVSDVSQWGQFQLFESTYESKLDIAQKVCEITGFEFYQDVDGDFVFKPPMYNLDTSQSRVYRIEDIDIISINFDEKEPQVTYMTCKGSHFHNQKISGLENEMGVQGQYIDFRLVAQYGWRPGNFESSYFTNGKSMQYACMNRMDILNAPSKSASVTIPIRPELRPGYPVYIPYLDAYYYCNSFAHAFSVGSGCTTTLQLIAKRSKFYAPGYTSQQGIAAVDLGDPRLPEKPLEVLDASGRPRLSGFPNVVMALDPDKIDPLFFVVGTNKEQWKDPATLQVLLAKAVSMDILQALPGYPGYYKIKTGNNGEGTLFHFDPSGNKSTDKTPKGKIVDLQAQANAYAGNVKKATTNTGRVKQAQQARDAAMETALALAGDSASTKQSVAAAQQQAAFAAKFASTVKDYQQSVQTQPADTAPSTTGFSDLALFRILLADVMAPMQRPDTFQSTYGGDPNSSITLLDLLADKKAIFSNKSIPGIYRYYSSASPDPAQQGQKHLTISIRKDAITQGQRVITSPAPLDVAWKKDIGPQYVKVPATTPEGLKPEAQLKDQVAINGMRVFTSDPNFPQGETIPTAAIREVMFASHDLLHEDHKASNGYKSVGLITGDDFRRKWSKNAAVAVDSPGPDDTLNNALSMWTVDLHLAIIMSFTTAFSGTPFGVIAFPDFPVPSVVTYQGNDISTSVPLTTFRFQGDTNLALPTAWVGSDTVPIQNAWRPLAGAYGEAYFDAFLVAAKAWYAKVDTLEAATPEEIDNIKSVFNTTMASETGVQAFNNSPKIRAKNVKLTRGAKPLKIPTAVFPISDARGYHVVGSYRYGRDVTIDPDGVFDVLHNQDVFACLSKDLVETVLKAVTNNQSLAKQDEIKVIRGLLQSFSAGDLEARGIVKTTANGLELNMANVIADGKDGISKVPVINAGYSLADLAPHTSRDFCSCKAAEASVLLDIAGTKDFVQFTEAGKHNYGNTTGDAPVDRAVQWLQKTTAQAVIPWTQSQTALRGAVPAHGPTSVIQAVRSATAGFDEAARDLDAKRKAFATAQANVAQAVTSLTNKPGT